MTCSVEEVHLNDEGTAFDVPLLDCDIAAADIDTAITKVILFQKPDKTTVSKDAAFKTDGTDGILRYITVEGDLDQTGKWKIQARVELSSGIWSSSIGSFKVYANLD